MTRTGRRAFVRTGPGRSYRKLIVIGTEGRVTERTYLNIIRRLYPDIRCSIQFARTSSNNCSNPHEVLECVKRWIKNNGPLTEKDEAWLVVDNDFWTKAQLDELRAWAAERSKHNFKRDMALSDPKFEYWLLLHFEDTNVVNSNDCTQKLRKHLPRYDKNLSDRDFAQEAVQLAISRARQRDTLRTGASTTVYKLVESILSCSGS